MKTLLCICAALLASTQLSAQDSAVVALKFESSLSSHPDRFVAFGAHRNATTCIDKELDESELPPLPPSGLWARMRLPDECNEFTDITHSFRDLRAIESKNFTITYKLDVSRASGFTITISWPENLDPAIVSAVIYDNNHFNIPDVDMLSETSVLIDNSFVREVNVDITYNFTETSVGESGMQTNDLLFAPNPAVDIVTSGAPLPAGSQIAVVNLLGETMLETRGNGNRQVLDLSRLPAGMYLLRVLSPDGTLQSQKLTVR